MNPSIPPTNIKTDRSISMARANLYSILFIIPIALMALLYYCIWGAAPLSGLFRENTPWSIYLTALFVFIIGVVVHEWIHAFSWMYFSKMPRAAIKFGINWKALSPYAHCTQPMDISAYRLGTMLPGLLLGIVPYVIGLFFGNIWIALFGLVFTFAASGDAIILWSLRRVSKGQWVEDHPHRAGCYVIDQSTG